MRILAIDYGLKNTGFAFGEKGLTMPIESIRTSDIKTLISHIKKLIDDEKIEKIVLGLPIYKDKKQAYIVEHFKNELEGNITIPIDLIDETSTSKQAFSEEFTKYSDIKRIKKTIHSKSAEKILERYFINVNFEEY